MNNAFPWFGSKARLSKWIIHLMPKHEKYAEIFGGSGAVLLRKPVAKVEIFNDINEGITNFFGVVRDSNKIKELKLKLELSPYNESDFHKFKESWKTEVNEIEKAFQWYYVAQLSFSGIWGKGPRFAVSSSDNVKSYISSIVNLDLLYERIKHVQILNRDWRKCFDLCNDKSFLIYLDPPYIPETRVDGKYPDEINNLDHKELVDRIVSSKAMIILSGYGHSIYNKLLKNQWKKLDKQVKVTCSHNCSGVDFKKTNRIESLYYNRNVSKVLNV